MAQRANALTRTSENTRQRRSISGANTRGQRVPSPVADEYAAQPNQEILHALGIRTKLAISQPRDPQEHEADRIADVFVAGASAPPGKQSDPGRTEIHRKCATCDEETIHRKALSQAPHHFDIGLQSGFGSGRMLSSPVRREYEGFFGTNLSHVRVHDDARANQAAHHLNAYAFTHGKHIFFAKGQFDPVSATGRRLLAHELAHVALGSAEFIIRRQAAPEGPKGSAVPALGVAEGLSGTATTLPLGIVPSVFFPYPPGNPLLIEALVGFVQESESQLVEQGKGTALLSNVKDLVTSPRQLLALASAFQFGGLAGLISPVTALFDMAVFAEHLQSLAIQLLLSPVAELSSWAAEAGAIAQRFVAYGEETIGKWIREHPGEALQLFLGGVLPPAVQAMALRAANQAGRATADRFVEFLQSPWTPPKEPEQGVFDIVTTRRKGESYFEPLGLISSKVERLTSYTLESAGPGAKIGYELGYAVGFTVVNIALFVISDGIGNIIVELGEALGRLAPALRALGEFVQAAGRIIVLIERTLSAATSAVLKPFEEILRPLLEILEDLRAFLRRLLGLSKEIGPAAAEALGQQVSRKLPGATGVERFEPIEPHEVPGPPEVVPGQVGAPASGEEARLLRESSFDRRYLPETKPILDTPGVRSKLASISEDARSLIELCDSPCLPPANQLLDADLKRLEDIQKSLGRPGYDRGLKEYFYKRRKAPGGLKQAIEDLDNVKRTDLEKFLDAEIIKGAPAGTTLSRDAKGRLVLDRGATAPAGTAGKVTEYDVRAYGKHDPMTHDLDHFFESHHGVQDIWAQETGVPGYNRKEAPGILLRDRRGGSPHQTVTARQKAREAGRMSRTYVQERKLMIEDLQRADVPKHFVDECLAANNKYYGDLYKNALTSGYSKQDLKHWFGDWKP